MKGHWPPRTSTVGAEASSSSSEQVLVLDFLVFGFKALFQPDADLLFHLDSHLEGRQVFFITRMKEGTRCLKTPAGPTGLVSHQEIRERSERDFIKVWKSMSVSVWIALPARNLSFLKVHTLSIISSRPGCPSTQIYKVILHHLHHGVLRILHGAAGFTYIDMDAGMEKWQQGVKPELWTDWLSLTSSDHGSKLGVPPPGSDWMSRGTKGQ